jgi:hypothetical protein
MGKIYRGYRTPGGSIQVFVVEGKTETTLPLRCKIGARDDEPYVGHSPTGFEVGYAGSGPAQLAFALVYDVLRDVHTAKRTYQRFKFRVIALLPPEEPFELTEEKIRQTVQEILAERETA